MTKELSKQLCVLCGIEAKLDGSNPNLSLQPVFPDFGNPENFVKLLELSVKNEKEERTILRMFAPFCCDDRTELLKQIVSYIERRCLFHDNIKQSIREAEWVYG